VNARQGLFVLQVMLLTAFAAPAHADETCSISPDPASLIGQTWTDLNESKGRLGALGCGTTAQIPVGNSGRVRMSFDKGQIVTSNPELGPRMVVGAYQAEDNIIVTWGDTSPLNYDLFQVAWDKDGKNIGHADVTSYIDRTHGFFSIRRPPPGHYNVSIRGCDSGGTSVSDPACRQGWSEPVQVEYKVPVIRSFGCITWPQVADPATLTMQRWADLGGGQGALGCPTGPAAGIPRRSGEILHFDHGSIAFSPDQGEALTIAAQFDGSHIVVEWGETWPFSYDKFLVRISRDGTFLQQYEVSSSTDGNWTYTPSDRSIDRKYSVEVEGCDFDPVFGSTCRQQWTIPVDVLVPAQPPPPSIACPGQNPVLGVLADAWIANGGHSGPFGVVCPLRGSAIGGSGQHWEYLRFPNGTIMSSPDQQPPMWVSAYQQNGDIFATWKATDPSHTACFTVKVTTDSGSSETIVPFAIGGNAASLKLVEPDLDAGQAYDIEVKSGCHGEADRSYTQAASVHYRPAGNSPVTGLDGRSVVAPKTADEALAGKLARAYGPSYWAACGRPLPQDAYKNEDNFAQFSYAKLFRHSYGPDYSGFNCPGVQWSLVQEVNNAIRRQEIKSRSGTTSDKCGRTGEYDVLLKGYISIYFKYRDLLEPDVRYRVIKLLNKSGPHDPADDTICDGIVGETENHHFNIEASRYLTNQILHVTSAEPDYDNARNGMNEYMLGELQKIFHRDFLEYNSRPYSRYTIIDLQNLYDFAQDPRVRTAAWMVLDYISAKVAVSTNDQRRNPPYRRHFSDYRDSMFSSRADPVVGRFNIYLAPTVAMSEMRPPSTVGGAASEMVLAAGSSYDPPRFILDLMIDPSHRTFYQRLQHAGFEIYASDPEFLITAQGIKTWPYLGIDTGPGGMQYDDDDFGTGPPTFLMPMGRFTSVSDMIRVGPFLYTDLTGDPSIPGNSCVAPGFACGTKPFIPPVYKCRLISGNWTFVDYASGSCRNEEAMASQHGFYAVVWGAGKDFGFFEAIPKGAVAGSPDMALQSLAKKTLFQNSGRTFSFGVRNSYKNWAGQKIEFEPTRSSRDAPYAIVSTGNPKIDVYMAHSGLPTGLLFAAGDVIMSEGVDVLRIANPFTHESILLDFSDRLNPKRIVE